MKKLSPTLLVCLILLLPNLVMGVTFDDLVERNDLYYEKFTDALFTGEVTGKEQGLIENGKREGAWISYRENGQLRYEGKYKNGFKDGAWFSYYKGNKSAWVQNHKNGIVWEYIE
jgi:antitoxin component YwqK of YwqJK toxin-antitoxin module